MIYARDAKKAQTPHRGLAVTVFGITLSKGRPPILCFVHPGGDDDACIVGIEIGVANIGDAIEEDVILTLELSSKILIGEEHIIRRYRPFVVNDEIGRACESTSETMTEISYKLPYMSAKTGAALIEPVFLQPTFGRRAKIRATTKDRVRLDTTIAYSVSIPFKIHAFSKLWRGPRFGFDIACVRAADGEAEAIRLATERATITDGRFVSISNGVYIVEFPFKKHPTPDGASMFVYQGRSDGEVKCREVFPDFAAIFGDKEIG